MEISPELRTPFFEYLLRLGDDQLILGHRLSEWCGHGPILEEDIALANIALDCIGAASALLRVAGAVEGQGRDEDALAYSRDPQQFRNARITELPIGDFADTIARQFLFDAYAFFLYGDLAKASHPDLAGIAGKTVKESQYHLRHTREWVLRLGDGTEESKAKIQRAFENVWEFTPELFLPDANEDALIAAGLAVSSSGLRDRWEDLVVRTLNEATLTLPADHPIASKATAPRLRRHTEHLGHLLAEMQILPRSYPGATW